MKKIINGVRYSTESATRVCSAWHGYATDFAHWEATLYQTPRSGRYFLAGRGGALSRFCRRLDGNTVTGGEGIIPLSQGEAFEFAQQHAPEQVEAFFPHLIED